jgi:hypothetical protein
MYVDIRTSKEAHLWASTACYGDRFTFLHVDALLTSQTIMERRGLLRVSFYLLC